MRVATEKFAISAAATSNFRAARRISTADAEPEVIMRTTVNQTELYFDADGPELTVDGERLRSRPTLVVIHGGPGFDHGYLRPGLSPLADSAQVLHVDLRGQGRSACRSRHARSTRWPRTSPRSATAWASTSRSSSATPPADSSRVTSRCATRACRPD